jgi:hypothetical protein
MDYQMLLGIYINLIRQLEIARPDKVVRRDNLGVLAERIVCAQRRRLVKNFVSAVSEYLRLESSRIAAIKFGDEHLLQSQLEAARKRKEEVKWAIREHQKEHGC